MENKIATFMKVSKQQYTQDFFAMDSSEAQDFCSSEAATEAYNMITLPCRATTGSAGYDFYLPKSICISNKPVLIHTGIRVRIDPGWILALFPRSGLGFKYGLRLVNTTGIVDSDYFEAANEGHIAAKLVADSPVELKAGDRFIQGILLPYGIATNDHILMAHRKGGFGSSGGVSN